MERVGMTRKGRFRATYAKGGEGNAVNAVTRALQPGNGGGRFVRMGCVCAVDVQ